MQRRFLYEYSSKSYRSCDLASLEGDRDYLVDAGQIKYDGEDFTGIDFGRFINHLRLKDTIKFGVEHAQPTVNSSIPYEAMMKRSRQVPNCKFDEDGSEESKWLVVVTNKDIQAGDSVEVTYDSVNYWVSV